MMVGKDAGKQGKIVHAHPSAEKVLVDGLNMLKHNRKPRKQGEKGEIVTAPRYVSIANVMLICPKCGKTARVGYAFLPNKKKARVCKKCSASIE